MITLTRGREAVKLQRELWDTLQELARQEGWRPIGAVDADSLSMRSIHGPGRSVMARDARALATALERLVNSEKVDGAAIDLAPIVQLVNFLRSGAFEIR